MSRMVVTDQAFGGVDQEAATARRFGAEFAEYACTSEAETIAAVTGADVVLVNFAPITEKVLSAMAPGATVIRYGIGYDNVDCAAAGRLGISVANVPDYGSDTVADHTVASLLTLLRKLPAYDRSVREHGWCPPGSLGSLPGFASTTVGLIGTGRIGLAVADRLRPFGFRVLAADPYADAAGLQDAGIELVDVPELFSRSHAVSLHAPLTPATTNLIDAEALARMPRGGILVNTSRGGLVDSDALADALQSGHLSAAALDVFEPEPLSPTSRLRALPQVLLTPHAAFFSDDSVAALQRLACEEAARALAGEPLRCRVA
ncbi:C-terminal binding protein [Blastococcus sp. SYSU DS0617]